MDLAERAASVRACAAWTCAAATARMRSLVRLRNVAAMTGVDATSAVVERGRARCRAEGLDDRITLLLADACATGLPGGCADFVWGEDAWCYVEDKPRLVSEAARLVRPGGTIAFTDWVEVRPASPPRSRALLRFMKFRRWDIGGYRALLEAERCEVLEPPTPAASRRTWTSISRWWTCS
jgi:SAM-dependent methyltransferase